MSPSSEGGVGNAAREIGRALASLGHEVTLLAPASETVAEPNLIRTPGRVHWRFEFMFDLGYTVSNLSSMGSALSYIQPDVVISHGLLSPALLQNSAVSRDAAWLNVQHGTYVAEMGWARYYPLMPPAKKIEYLLDLNASVAQQKVLFRFLDSLKNTSFVGVSQKTASELASLGCTRSKCYSVLNGVNKEVFHRQDKVDCVRALRSAGVSIDEADVNIIHVNPGFRKGTHVLLKSFRRLQAKHRRLKLIIVGTPSKSLRRYTEAFFKSEELNGRVVFCGHVARWMLPLFYGASDLVAVPSYSEGCPLVLLEALASGAPAVTSDTGGIPECMKIAEMEDLMVRVTKHDFSAELVERMEFCIENRDSLSNRIAISRLPTWVDSAKEYVSISKVTKDR